MCQVHQLESAESGRRWHIRFGVSFNSHALVAPDSASSGPAQVETEPPYSSRAIRYEVAETLGTSSVALGISYQRSMMQILESKVCPQSTTQRARPLDPPV